MGQAGIDNIHLLNLLHLLLLNRLLHFLDWLDLLDGLHRLDLLLFSLLIYILPQRIELSAQLIALYANHLHVLLQKRRLHGVRMRSVVGRVELASHLFQLSLQFKAASAHVLPLLLEVMLKLRAHFSDAMLDLLLAGLVDLGGIAYLWLLLEKILGVPHTALKRFSLDFPFAARHIIQSLVLLPECVLLHLELRERRGLCVLSLFL